MTVDKGGLRYPITVEDEFSTETAHFKAEVRGIRTEWARLRRELGKGVAPRNARGTRETEKAVRSEQKLTKALRRGKDALSLNSKAQREYNRERERGATSREKARIAARESFKEDQKALTAQQARRKAEQGFTAILNKRRVVLQRLAIAQRRSLDLTEKEKIQLGLASKATFKLTTEQKRLAAVRQRLNAAQRRSSNEESLRLEAQRIAIERITAARVRQLALEELSRRGFAPSGQALPVQDDPAKQRGILGFFDKLRKRTDRVNKSGNRVSFTFRRLFGILAAFAAARLLVRFFRQAIVEGIKFNAEIERAELGMAGILAAVGDIRDATGETVKGAEALAAAAGIARGQVAALRKDALLTTASFQDLIFAFQTGLAPGLQAGLNIDEIRKFTRQISIAATSIGLDQTQLAEEIRSILTGTIQPRQTRIAVALGISNEDIRTAKEAGRLFEFLQEQFDAFERVGRKAASTLPGLFERIKDALTQILGEGLSPTATTIRQVLATLVQDLVQVDDKFGTIALDPTLVEAVSLIGEGITAVVAEAERLGTVLSRNDLLTFAEGVGSALAFAVTIIGSLIEGAIRGSNIVFNTLFAIRNLLDNIGLLDIFDEGVFTTILSSLIAIIAAVQVLGILVLAVKGAAALTASAFVAIRLAIVPITFLLGGVVRSLALANAGAVALGLTVNGLIPTFIAMAAAAAALGFVLAQLSGDLDISETRLVRVVSKFISELGITAKTDVRGILAIVANTEKLSDVMQEHREELRKLDEFYDKTKDSEVAFVDTLVEGLDNVAKRFTSLFKDRLDDAARAAAAAKDQGDFLLANSQAIANLRSRQAELTQQVLETRDATLAQVSALGLVGGIAEQVLATTKSQLETKRELATLAAEEEQTLGRIKSLNKEISDLGFLGVDGLEGIKQAEANVVALQDRLLELSNTRLSVESQYRDILVAELTLISRRGAADLQFNTNLLGIEATRVRALRLAELEGRTRDADLIRAQQELDTIQLKGDREEERIKKSIAAQRDLIKSSKELLAVFQPGDIAGLSETDKQRISDAQTLLQTQQGTLANLERQLIFTQLLQQEEEKRVANETKLLELQKESPLLAGLFQGVLEASQEIPELFQSALDTMKGAITQFSQFIAQSIVSAFDPASDETIFQRFGKFLQALATQIITTLVTLAITAALLNAASGGLLGPLISGLSTASGGFGRAEGGEVDPGRRHERSQRSRRRAASRRATGLAEGGSASAPRPAGLDSRDTVNAWLDPREWVIKASSVAQAGRDTMDRINKGLFDPYALREATGLRGWRRATTVAATRGGPGLATGGEASQVTEAVGLSEQASGGAGASVAIMSPNEDTTERLVRGGGDALLKFLASNGIVPNA